MIMLCRLISSKAATAAVAALLFGRAFRRPSTLTHAPAPVFDPDPPPPIYSSSASAPSLSSSLRAAICGRDFFFLTIALAALEDDVDVEHDDVTDAPDVVDPVVRVGGPGEYIAAADPGRDGGRGKCSGLM